MSTLDLNGTVTLAERPFSYGLVVDHGEHIAVVGPNGAGKSTLLRVLAGLQPLGAGCLTLDDTVLDRPEAAVFVAPHERPIALQAQDGALFPHLDVIDNVAFPLRARSVKRRAAHAVALDHLERVGVAHLAPHRPSSLSGGEAAKVALARSLAADPQVLLLDEPAAALDVEARAGFRRLVAELDQTIVTVTHDPLEAQLLGSRFAVIQDGDLVQTGTAEEVAAAPANPWVAGFAGVNIVTGTAHDTRVLTPSGATLTLAEHIDGPVHVAFPASAVVLARSRPTGSARNVYEATVAALAVEGDRVRVSFDAGFHATALVTASAAAELDLRPGGPVWASIKATELTVLPA